MREALVGAAPDRARAVAASRSSGASTVASIRSSVVLPAPLGPSRPTTPPAIGEVDAVDSPRRPEALGRGVDGDAGGQWFMVSSSRRGRRAGRRAQPGATATSANESCVAGWLTTHRTRRAVRSPCAGTRWRTSSRASPSRAPSRSASRVDSTRVPAASTTTHRAIPGSDPTQQQRWSARAAAMAVSNAERDATAIATTSARSSTSRIVAIGVAAASRPAGSTDGRKAARHRRPARAERARAAP